MIEVKLSLSPCQRLLLIVPRIMKQALSPIPNDLQPTLAACKQQLDQHYQAKLKAVLLYGSAARAQLTDQSDIDLLVLLAPPFDYFDELRTIVDLLYPLQLESPYWISAKPADITEFDQGLTQLYRNAKQEGRRL